MIELLVKGDRYAAAQAAADRSIPAVFVREDAWGRGATMDYRNLYETRLHVPDAFHDAVSAWFCEKPYEAPYPVGACLHYSLNR